MALAACKVFTLAAPGSVVLTIVGCRVVCISRTEGANAREVARAVSDALGFGLVDEEILQRAAAEAGVDQDIIADLEQALGSSAPASRQPAAGA